MRAKRLLWPLMVVLGGALAHAGCGLAFAIRAEPEGTSDASAGDEASAVNETSTGAEGASPEAGVSYASVVLSDSPVAYWRFDDSSNTNFAKDEIDNKHPANAAGHVAFGTQGAVGTAATFPGSLEVYLDVGNAFGFTNNVSFTIEGWIKPDADDQQGWIIQKRKNEPSLIGYIFYTKQAHELQFEDWGATLTIWSDGPIPAGFVHVAIVVEYRMGKGNAYLYVNAQRAQQHGYDNTDAVPDTDAPLHIGQQFKGVIDEMALYDKALPPDRILEHYRAAGH